AVPTPQELAQAGALLTPPQMTLFLRLQPSEQAHSLNIFRQLIDQGEENRDLLVAALLHDVGKCLYPLSLWDRVLAVLAKGLFPARARDWGWAEPRGWRRAFVVAEQHPRWGAALAAQAGCTPLTVNLIRRHQSPDSYLQLNGDPVLRTEDSPNSKFLENQLLQRLQLFDEEN
ncbi:MAG TPA: HD domain-containing protein, partial [Anaerolineales bacterium]